MWMPPSIFFPFLVIFSLCPAEIRGQDRSPNLPSSPEPRADLDAVKTLDEAIHKFDLKKLGWMEMTLWDQVELQGLTFMAQGIYVAGPDHRLHLDLKVNLAGTTGRLEVVCDGSILGDTWQVGTGDRLPAHRVDLKKVLETLDGPAIPPEVREEIIDDQFFTGVAPFLKTLQKRLVFTRQEKHVTWNDHDTIRLTGVWNAEARRSLSPANMGPFLPWPQKCILFLDSQSLWPYRLEGWGSPAPGTPESLLLQLEFRDQKFGQPPSPERMASLFQFHPGPGEVADQTQRDIDLIKARVQHLAGQKPIKK